MTARAPVVLLMGGLVLAALGCSRERSGAPSANAASGDRKVAITVARPEGRDVQRSVQIVDTLLPREEVTLANEVPATSAGILAGLSSSASGGQGMARPAPPLKFVTFNLFHGGVISGLNGDAKELDRRLEMAAEGLRAVGADVIGLQEASTSRQRGKVAARLAARLGFHHVYAPASSRFFGSNGIDQVVALLLNFTEGPAILSRFPIEGWQVHDLPRCGRLMDSRVLLDATLQTPWGPVRAFSTHTRGDPCQIRRVAEIVLDRRQAWPSVLMGDFNAAEPSPAIAVLTGGSRLVDAYRSANPALPGPTVWQRIEEPAPTVWRRVDYIFVVPGAEFPGRVVSSRVVLNAPRHFPDGTTLWPSDHYGVLAELEVFPPPRGGRADSLRPRSRFPRSDGAHPPRATR